MQVDPFERGLSTVLVPYSDRFQANITLRASGCMPAALLVCHLINQRLAPFEGRQAPRQRAADLGQALDRCNQEQHGGDESHEAASRGVAASALQQGDADHC